MLRRLVLLLAFAPLAACPTFDLDSGTFRCTADGDCDPARGEHCDLALGRCTTACAGASCPLDAGIPAGPDAGPCVPTCATPGVGSKCGHSYQVCDPAASACDCHPSTRLVCQDSQGVANPSDGTCCVVPGAGCSSSGECCSGVCASGRCCLGPGASCKAPSDCCSAACSANGCS